MESEINTARLIKLRTGEDISQKALAQKLGISTSTVSMYENGNRTPDIKTLKKICNFYGVSADYLLDKSEEDPSLDISKLLGDIKARLESAESLIFNGKMITESEKDRLFNSLLLAAHLTFDIHTSQERKNTAKPTK